LIGAAKLFPICLVVFVVTGGYMLSLVHVSMSTGFVVAGLVGVVLLLASGLYLAGKGKALAHVLEGIAAQGADQPAPKLAPPPLIMMLPTVNTGIALAVAFAMVLKPTSIPISLGIVAAGIVLGVLAAPRRPAGARAPMAASEG
jgi:hypothetical protein